MVARSLCLSSCAGFNVSYGIQLNRMRISARRPGTQKGCSYGKEVRTRNTWIPFRSVAMSMRCANYPLSSEVQNPQRVAASGTSFRQNGHALVVGSMGGSERERWIR